MPLHHVVLIRFHPGTPPEAVGALDAGLRALPAQIDQIVTYKVGPDLGLSPGSWDFALSADFASVEDFEAYRAHPAHVALVSDLLEPITEERRSVQFAC